MNMTDFTIKDSGKRQQFSTGMVRDSQEKVRYDLIPIWMLTRFAEHLTKGAKKYKPRNWQKASTPQELDRFIQSFWRHWVQYLEGEDSEDHFSAIIFNLCGMELVRQRLGVKWKEQLEKFQMGEGDL
jgi:hypothetical protein